MKITAWIMALLLLFTLCACVPFRNVGKDVTQSSEQIAMPSTAPAPSPTPKLIITTPAPTISPSPAPTAEPEELSGNTPGNIVNGGHAALYEGFIYFANRDDDDNDYGIYKADSNFSNIVKICNDFASDLNIIDGWIYYSNWSKNGKIYKIRTDGSELEKLNNDESSCLNVVDGWIYYLKNSSDNIFSSEMYKMRIDGSERSRICDEENAADLIVIGDWIYFNHEHPYEDTFYTILYKMKTDGSEKTLLKEEDLFWYINVIGNRIYYVDYNWNLARIDIDGSYISIMNNIPCSYINIVGDWVYFSKSSYKGWDEDQLCKMKLDGSNLTKLNNEKSHFINVVEGWIFYYSENTDNKFVLYKIKTDGTGNSKALSGSD